MSNVLDIQWQEVKDDTAHSEELRQFFDYLVEELKTSSNDLCLWAETEDEDEAVKKVHSITCDRGLTWASILKLWVDETEQEKAKQIVCQAIYDMRTQ